MFSISFRKHRNEKQEKKKTVDFDYQNVNWFLKGITSLTLVEN